MIRVYHARYRMSNTKWTNFSIVLFIILLVSIAPNVPTPLTCRNLAARISTAILTGRSSFGPMLSDMFRQIFYFKIVWFVIRRVFVFMVNLL